MVKTKDKKTEDILSSWHEKQELWEDKKTEIGQKTKCLSVFLIFVFTIISGLRKSYKSGVSRAEFQEKS